MPSLASDHHGVVTVFLCGDVMIGRGVDQVLPHPSDPRIHEPYVRDARDYVELAEHAHGPIGRGVDYAYPWGDGLALLDEIDPDVRLINLETAVTLSDDCWRGKGINYRMHPGNVPCLTAAGIDACALANNHVLDWGYSGLRETLATLQGAGILAAGAGADLDGAAAPAVLPTASGARVLVFSLGSESSGIPGAWAATARRPGVWLLDEAAGDSGTLAERVRAHKRPGDVAVASLHWGPNWGYEIDPAQRALAHALIEEGGVDVVHGHSSHHAKGIEVHRGRLILYGCGDLINDYEGIAGHESFRSDLGLMYFARLDARTGALAALRMVPMRMRRLRLERAGPADAAWLRDRLDGEGRRLGTRLEHRANATLVLAWP
ncbi:MAG: CapA family protein [Gammaproteobacteria bacterium]|nr:CapA family protein [Gammaproteobacteria bacterium]